MAKCDDCSVNLGSKSSLETKPAAGSSFWNGGAKQGNSFPFEGVQVEAERKGTHSNPAVTPVIECHEKECGGKEGNSFAFEEEQAESQTHSLNDDLTDMHMDMQLLSSLTPEETATISEI